jgi:hypothetical protein
MAQAAKARWQALTAAVPTVSFGMGVLRSAGYCIMKVVFMHRICSIHYAIERDTPSFKANS